MRMTGITRGPARAAAALVALALIAAACSGSGEGADSSAATTTALPPEDGADGDPPDTTEFIPETADGRPFLELNLEDKIEAFLASPNTTFAQNVITEMGLTGERRWGPWILDLMRLGGTQGISDSSVSSFEQISGIESTGDFGDDFVQYGTWLRGEQIDPGAGYHDWKRRVFSQILEPGYFELLSGVNDPLTLAAIQWGGVRRGGIPELNNPAKLTVAEATFMTDEELILGAVVNGQPVSYPLRFLARHELANDVINNVPVSLGYCTLCRTGLLFDGRVGGRVLTFQTSGLLLDSNKVMVDNETDSLWNHLAGRAISGPLEGTVLETFPLVTTRWGDWKAQYPNTLTLDTPEPTYLPGPEDRSPIIYDYTPGAAYSDYYSTDNLWFPTLPTPPPFDEKTGVVTLIRGADVVAFEQQALEQVEPFVISVGGEQLIVVPNIGGARIYLANAGAGSALLSAAARAAGGRLGSAAVVSVTHETLTLTDASVHPRVVSGQSFWFAWSGLYPNTAVWTGDDRGTVRHS